MKKLLTAIAMTIALPAAAHAQTAPPAAPKAAPTAHASHDMQGMSCKDMHATMTSGHAGHQMAAGSGGQADHSKMDHSKMDHSKMAGCSDATKTAAKPAPADPHANHQR